MAAGKQFERDTSNATVPHKQSAGLSRVQQSVRYDNKACQQTKVDGQSGRKAHSDNQLFAGQAVLYGADHDEEESERV